MNSEKPIRDQAERLRRRVERKTEQAAERKETLPPRSEVHRQKQKKTNVKVKYPVIRLMALFFILLPVTFFSIITYLEGTNRPFGGVTERAGIEMIDVDNSGDRLNKDENEDEEDVPLAAEHSDTDQIDLAAGAAPESTGDKDDSNAAESKEAAVNATDVQGTEASSEETATESEETVVYHTVKPNETLFRVAMHYYKSQDGIPIIKKANNLQGNEIQAGQVLKIPIHN